MFFTVSETPVLRTAFYLLLLLTLLSSGPTLAADCKTPEECKAQLQNDSISIGLRLHWQPAGDITLNNNNRLVFPTFEPVSGLYRFEMHRQQVFVYIGETENLKRRFAEYRAPNKTNKTNRRICAELLRTLRAGGSASISIVTDEASLCTDGGCTAALLGIGNHRKLLEQLAIFAVPSGIHVLNRERVLTAKERKLVGVKIKAFEPEKDGNCS